MSKKNITIGTLLGVTAALGVISAKNFMELRAQRTLKEAGTAMLHFFPLDTLSPTSQRGVKGNHLRETIGWPMRERFFLEKRAFPWKITTEEKCFKNNEVNSRILLDLFKNLKHKGHIEDETLGALLFSITEKGK